MLAPERAWVVCPVDGEGYPIREDTKVCGISEILNDIPALHT